MDWINEVQNRLKRKNQILFAKNSEFLADLTKSSDNGLVGI